MRVMLKCKKCGVHFYSGIEVVSVNGFNGLDITPHPETCSICGKSSTYDLPDYFLEID